MNELLLIFFILAVAALIEGFCATLPNSWESCMKLCKENRKKGIKCTMRKTTFGWKVVYEYD